MAVRSITRRAAADACRHITLVAQHHQQQQHITHNYCISLGSYRTAETFVISDMTNASITALGCYTSIRERPNLAVQNTKADLAVLKNRGRYGRA